MRRYQLNYKIYGKILSKKKKKKNLHDFWQALKLFILPKMKKVHFIIKILLSRLDSKVAQF